LRTTVRLTPIARVRACSVGRRAPGPSLPHLMSAARRAITRSARWPEADGGAEMAGLSGMGTGF
jgi:hypothetical protein